VPSGIIQVTLLVIAMGLALLPFFEWYKPDVPHRMAAIKQLEEAMPAELLSEDAEWFQAWKASGIDQEVYVPRYFRQLDLPGGERKCFTSAAAMVAAHAKLINTQQQYESVLRPFGDTTSINAHVKALESLGLKVRFTQTADAEDLIEAIDAGIPVLVGWLHQGNMLRGEPPMCGSETCGHWSVIHGYSGRFSNDPSWLMSDPAGLPDIERGGHNPALSGYRVSVRQAAFHQRWQVDGPRSGWAMFAEPQ
jgi:hypothetical protein|tara:strand:- start:527 stop:1276 length:750 start_codon:yes stop_codon:yes gene_type:complete